MEALGYGVVLIFGGFSLDLTQKKSNKVGKCALSAHTGQQATTVALLWL